MAQRKTSSLPLLTDRKDPWDKPEFNRTAATEPQPASRSSCASGNVGYGYGSVGYRSAQEPPAGYGNGYGYSTSTSRTSTEQLPGKIDRVCKNLNLAAKSISESQVQAIDADRKGECIEVGKGFWGGIGSFFANDTTREVILIMSIIALKTALIYAYVKADQKKIKVVEFL